MAVMYNGKTLRENCEEMGLNYATVLERRRKHPFQDPKESLIPPRTNCGGRGHAKFFTERGTPISILYESKGDYDRIISAYKYWGSYSEAAQRIRIDWTDEKIESWCRRLGLNLGKAKKLFAKGTCIEDIYLALMTKHARFLSGAKKTVFRFSKLAIGCKRILIGIKKICLNGLSDPKTMCSSRENGSWHLKVCRSNYVFPMMTVKKSRSSFRF